MRKLRLLWKALRIVLFVRRVLMQRGVELGSQEALLAAAWMPGDPPANLAASQGKPLSEIVKVLER